MAIKMKNALLLGVAPLVLALGATPAAAQVAETPGAGPIEGQTGRQSTDEPSGSDQTVGNNEVVVTGSRIARPNLTTAAPVAVVGQEEFRLSGVVNVEQVLNQLPQVVPGTTAFSNNPGGGVATLNLRGLGATRTLVLVNGRRYIFFDPSQLVDLNTIPQFLLDGVDTLTGGASAVYGSDAVAGVVNFRLRGVRGVEAGGQYNITERGDGARYNAFLALGSEFADGRGSATVFGEYFNRKDIFQGGRPFSAATQQENATATGLVPGGSSTTETTRATFTCPASIAGNVFCGPAGGYFAQPGVARVRQGTDLFNFGAVNYLQVPQERYLLGGFGEFEFADNHSAYTEVTFINNRVANELAATPVTGTFNVNIAAVSPFLAPSAITALQQLDTVDSTPGNGVVPLALQRRILETGGRNTLDERNAFRLLVGAKGPVFGNFNYDLNYMYARTRNANVQAGNISRAAFQAGLNGSAPAINIFGPGSLSPESVDQINILAQNGTSSILQVATASVAGGLFDLGFGGDEVGIALGVEYRKVAAEFIPDTALSSGDVIGFNAGLPTAGDYDVREVFGELRIPLIADRPGFQELEVTVAGRYSDYSLANVGGVGTYAATARYAPIEGVAFRGQYQRAVRAPNVSELFGGRSIGFPQATDPCAQATAATDTAIRNLCIATGVPAAAVGQASLQINQQIQANFGGNPDLQEETSDSFTAGVVIRPSFIPGLAITADYFNIKVEDSISTLGGGLNNTLNLCYNVIQDINSVYCQALVGSRNTLGQFADDSPPNILNANIGELQTEGVDVQVDYSTRLGFSVLSNEDARLNFFALATYTDRFDITPVAGLDQVNECAGRFGVLACGNATPKFKAFSRVTLADGPGVISLRWRHLGPVRDDDADTTYFVERIGAQNYFDLSASFDVSDNFNFSVGVNNLFDRQPPILGNNQNEANTQPEIYDPLGRDFFAAARFRF